MFGEVLRREYFLHSSVQLGELFQGAFYFCPGVADLREDEEAASVLLSDLHVSDLLIDEDIPPRQVIQ